jgi:hypothetical protein
MTFSSFSSFLFEFFPSHNRSPLTILTVTQVSDVAFSKDAMSILTSIKRALEEGRAAQVVQTTPHLVLLSRPFYDQKLRPLLSRWALIWLLAHGCNGNIQKQILKNTIRATFSVSFWEFPQ